MRLFVEGINTETLVQKRLETEDENAILETKMWNIETSIDLLGK